MVEFFDSLNGCSSLSIQIQNMYHIIIFQPCSGTKVPSLRSYFTPIPTQIIPINPDIPLPILTHIQISITRHSHLKTALKQHPIHIVNILLSLPSQNRLINRNRIHQPLILKLISFHLTQPLKITFHAVIKINMP